MNQYLIAHIGHTAREHEHITWWKPHSIGYSMCIDKAGLYDEAEARSICRYGSSIAVPKSVAESIARSTPYYRRSDGTLNKLYDGDSHRVVPNSQQAWTHLLNECLASAIKPERPTPIPPKKARAVYLSDDQDAHKLREALWKACGDNADVVKSYLENV